MTLTLPTFTDILAFFKWLLASGWSQVIAAYNSSHKWFAIGAIAFVVLIWLGYVAMPKLPAKDAALEKQVASLSEKLDTVSSELHTVSAKLDALKSPPVALTSSFKKKR